MSFLKQLGSDSVVYGLGGVIAKGVSFLLIPILTRVFSPAEYGSMEMLIVVSSFIASVLVMGMDSAQSMYFYKVKKDGSSAQAQVVTAILQFRAFWGVLVVLLASILSPYLNLWFFNGELKPIYFIISFAGALFSQIMIQSAEVMRLLYRPWDYILITISNSIFSGLFGLFCIIFLQLGILGFFVGILVSSIFVGLIGWFRIRELLIFGKIQWHLWPALIRFGAPLMPSGIVFYFMSTADRWFIQYFHGANELGLFAVAARLALILSLIVETFRQAWWPIAMDSLNNDEDTAIFSIIARLYLGLACAAIILLTYLSPWLVSWVAGPNYAEAWKMVGILSFQAVFYGFFLIVSVGIWKSEKTYLSLPIMVLACIVGLGLNWLLVPMYAGLGASIASVLTYFIWVILTLYISQILMKVDFQFKIMALQILTTVCFLFLFIYQLKGEFILINLPLAAFLSIALIYLSVDQPSRKKISAFIFQKISSG